MHINIKTITAVLLALLMTAALCACSSVRAGSDAGTTVVTVSDIDEFLDAIGPGREIHMNAGTYNISEAAAYGVDDEEGYYTWNNYGYSDEYELEICGVENMSVDGQNAEIVTTPRTSTVIVYKNCSDVSLSGLTIGHTVGAEACEGGVVKFDLCDNVKVDDCSLYGCGTVGIWVNATKKLSVKDSEIHHCSSAAVSANNSTAITMDNTKFYDCGGSDSYARAQSAFVLYDVDGLSVSGCEIHNNYLDSLVSGYSLKNIKLDNLSIHDNHISTLFDYEGNVELTAINVRNNVIDSFIGYGGNGYALIDGEQLYEDDMCTLWEDQLSSHGLGTVETDQKEIDLTGAKEVHVKTADEFLAAIASDTVIHIDVPKINLTEASDYPGQGDNEYWNIPQFENGNYEWVYVFDGSELCIGNVSNFHICGGEIVTEPRYANVLSFYSCLDISMENVVAGHTTDMGECCGGVLYLNNTVGMIVKDCDLYGCGILGISTDYVSDLQVENTVIHDCSYGAATLYDSYGIMFIDCTIKNCPKPHFVLSNCFNFTWNGTLMDSDSTFSID